MDSSGKHDEPTEEWIADRARALVATTAPDVWPLALERAGREAVHKRQPRRLRIMVAAALLLTAGITWMATFGGSSQTVETIVVANPDQPVPPPSAQLPSPDASCADRLVEELLAGSEPSLRRGATTSPEQLALTSPRVIRGNITGAQQTPTGSFLFIEVDGEPLPVDEPGNRPALWTRGFPAEDVQARFVAFLTGDELHPDGGGDIALATNPDGLWVACDGQTPARSVHSVPIGDAWDQWLDDGPSLAAVWDLDAAAVEGFEHETAAVDVVNQASIFSLRLHTGEWFRVAIPEARGNQLTVTERRAPNPIGLSNELVDMTLVVDRCPVNGDAILAPTGATLSRNGAGLTVCRSAEGLRLEVAPAPEPIALQQNWDVLTMRLGSRFGQDVEALWTVRGCEGCTPIGPMIIGNERAEVVVARPTSTSIQAFAAGDLSLLWRTDFDNSVVLNPFLDLAIVDVLAGPLIALDARTGDERWRISQNPSEGDLRVHAHGPGVTLVETSFVHSPNDGPPVLRRIEVDTGEILWEARGTENREWGSSIPVVLDDVVMTFDQASTANPLFGSPIPTDPFADSPTVYGFDLMTGEQLWSLTLDGRGPANQQAAWLAWVEVQSGRVAIFKSDRGDLVRIDPADGALLWRITVGDVALAGTDFTADGTLGLALSNSILIDPTSGQVALPAPP